MTEIHPVVAAVTARIVERSRDSRAAYLDLIRRERRAEMALEFQRFFDVVRYGQAYAQQALADRPNFNYSRNRFYPIPQSERDTNKGL